MKISLSLHYYLFVFTDSRFLFLPRQAHRKMGSSSPAKGAESQDKGPAIVAAITTVTSLSTLFVIARIYTKAKIVRQFHPDDYLIIFSVVSQPSSNI